MTEKTVNPIFPRRGGPRASGLLALAGVLLLSACAGTSRLASTWRDPGFQDGSLNRLLVVAVGRTPGERRAFEDRFASALHERGVNAEPSYLLIGDGRVDSALVEAQMHRAGCDGILVTRVIDRRVVRRYYGQIFGSPYYNLPRHRVAYYGPPSVYHEGWWPYYSAGYAYSIEAPGPIEDQQISVETNLYRHANGQLVWSGLSRQLLSPTETLNNSNDGVVRELVSDLTRSGVVRVYASSAHKPNGVR